MAQVYNQKAADKMGVGEIGQVVVMIHSGSRGLGHQVARFEGVAAPVAEGEVRF